MRLIIIANDKKNGGVAMNTTSEFGITINDVADFIESIKKAYGKKLTPGLNTFTSIKDTAFFCTTSVKDDEKGPIAIVPSTLSLNNKNQEVYLISLGGTEFVKGQATDLKTDFLVALEMNNDYLTAAKEAILNNIPSGSSLILTGYSLGGMVAQQISANKEIVRSYQVENVVAVGSPLISPIGREGKIRRVCDVNDVVPYLSLCSMLFQWMYKNEKVVEDGGYKTPIGAHALSYVSSDVWSKYDPLGISNGGSTITFDTSNLVYYPAPIR